MNEARMRTLSLAPPAGGGRPFPHLSYPHVPLPFRLCVALVNPPPVLLAQLRLKGTAEIPVVEEFERSEIYWGWPPGTPLVEASSKRCQYPALCWEGEKIVLRAKPYQRGGY